MKVNLFDILSKSQSDLMKYVVCKLERFGYGKNLHITNKYIFATGEIPVLLVAHLDTVHKQLPDICYDKRKRNIMGI